MADKPQPADPKANAEPSTTPPAPRRSPGHRGADARDTVAEMALRAQEISQEAGSKIAMAMKDVINAAAGVAGFAVESARDLVQYMVRRGQMTQEEADRVIREAEDAHRQQKKVVRESGGAATQSTTAKKSSSKAATKSAAKPAKPAKTAAKKSAPAKKKSTTASAPARSKAAATKTASKSAKKKR
jgi:polyhydroxyalkanoate synthesis regulator phasin